MIHMRKERNEKMDLNKIYEFFQPEKVRQRIHIVGCGSVGSTLAENLARCGLEHFALWDFDTVEPHNIVNQMFTEEDVGKNKSEATRDIIKSINPEADVEIHTDGWDGNRMSGYVFLCVDSIELRNQIVDKLFNDMSVVAVFDFRTSLESAQHYAADWSDLHMKQVLKNSMNFTHAEAADETPTSACGITLGVATTVRLIVALGVNNFINFVKGRGIKKFIQIDGFNYVLDAFD